MTYITTKLWLLLNSHLLYQVCIMAVPVLAAGRHIPRPLRDADPSPSLPHRYGCYLLRHIQGNQAACGCPP